MTDASKRQVGDFWDAASCGEELFLPSTDLEAYAAQAAARYAVEPYIPPFAEFESARGELVLEIGVGLGADHERFARAGAQLYGVDLTPRAVGHTRRRLTLAGFTPRLSVADAETLPFREEQFDYVYSWGVLHHTPDTIQAISEVYRVLRPGGRARVMIYHKWSMVGLLLWARYGLGRFRPGVSLAEIYAWHLESPGTKAYTVDEARELFARFEDVRVEIELSSGDLLLPGVGQRHRGWVLSAARALWPRALVRKIFPRGGLTLMVAARKPQKAG